MALVLNVRSSYSDSAVVKESPLNLAYGSKVTYHLDVTNWGDTPTSPTFSVLNLNTGEDVTASVAPGVATVEGNLVKLPELSGLLLNSSYLITINYVLNGDTRVSFINISVGRPK